MTLSAEKRQEEIAVKFSNHYKMGRLIWKKMESNDMMLRKRLYFLGNLTPDLLGSFLFRQHSYTSCGSRLRKLLRRLIDGDIARSSVLFSFYSGIISHYVCDFLCFAHTTSFKGNVRDHHGYEKKQVVRADDMLPFNVQRSMNFSYSELILGIESCVDKREQMLSKSICVSILDIPLAVYAAIWVASALYLHAEQLSAPEVMPSQLMSA